MNFKIDRKYFYNKLLTVSRAISSFSPTPALSGILVDVKENKIILTGSDADVSIKTVIIPDNDNLLTILSTGSVVLESRYLVEIVKKIDSTSIELELGDAELVTIKSGHGKFVLNGIGAGQYPNIDFTRPEQGFTLSNQTLKNIIEQTSFACSTNVQRPVLTGVNFEATNGTLFCSATDSYRMAQKTIPLDTSETNFKVTVPNKALQELVKTFGEEDEVNIFVDSKKIQFITDVVMFQSRLLDGTYPNIHNIIPTSSSASLEVDSKELEAVVGRTDFIKNEKLHLVKLVCTETETRIKTSSSEIGNSDEKLESGVYSGSDLSLAFNGDYLSDAVKGLNSDKARIEFVGEAKPAKIVSPEDDSIVMVIVPVRSYED